MEIVYDGPALARIGASGIERLTAAAVASTFHRETLTAEERAANQRVVAISTASCEAAAANANQLFAAAFETDAFAGYVIATRHATEGLELDWLMVHPEFQGGPVAPKLMQAGMNWLGLGNPMWLNVIQFNQRAIRFYERFGFTIDPDARTAHVIPHFIMRRAPSP
jgi:ribosomal protein S18 acetylase RimI-like enzyme